jgi:phosphotriesterase-related protein
LTRNRLFVTRFELLFNSCKPFSLTETLFFSESEKGFLNRASLATSVAMTVEGPISNRNLGFILPHEHILIDTSSFFVPINAESDRFRENEPISLANLSWVRYNARHNRDCLSKLDEEAAVNEVGIFGRAGGNTIVDLTCREMGRDPLTLARISRSTGVHIIIGTGFYTAGTHPPAVAQASAQELAAGMVDEINVGVDGTVIKAGVIGEIGCSWPLADGERKVLEAAAIAQSQTGLAITIHPSRNEAGPNDAIKVLRSAGADLRRVVICHMDRCGYSLETRLDILEAGCYVEYDLFGKEGYYPAQPALADGHLPDMPNDVGRIKEIADLIQRGWTERILISHDNCLKTNFTRWGGPGFAHIIERAIPYMRIYGYSENQIRQLTRINPARMLSGDNAFIDPQTKMEELK